MCRNCGRKLRASGMLAAGLQHNKVRRHQQNPLQSIQMSNCKGTVIERDVAVDCWTGSLRSHDGCVVGSERLREKRYAPKQSEWVVKFWIENCVRGQCKNNCNWDTRCRFWNSLEIERRSYILKKLLCMNVRELECMPNWNWVLSSVIDKHQHMHFTFKIY